MFDQVRIAQAEAQGHTVGLVHRGKFAIEVPLEATQQTALVGAWPPPLAPFLPDEIHCSQIVLVLLPSAPAWTRSNHPGVQCRELIAFERPLAGEERGALRAGKMLVHHSRVEPPTKTLTGDSKMKRASSCHFKSPCAQAQTDTLSFTGTPSDLPPEIVNRAAAIYIGVYW